MQDAHLGAITATSLLQPTIADAPPAVRGMPGAVDAAQPVQYCVAALAASNCGTCIAAACSSSHGADVVVVWQCETSGRGALAYAQTAVSVRIVTSFFSLYVSLCLSLCLSLYFSPLFFLVVD